MELGLAIAYCPTWGQGLRSIGGGGRGGGGWGGLENILYLTPAELDPWLDNILSIFCDISIKGRCNQVLAGNHLKHQRLCSAEPHSPWLEIWGKNINLQPTHLLPTCPTIVKTPAQLNTTSPADIHLKKYQITIDYVYGNLRQFWIQLWYSKQINGLWPQCNSTLLDKF